MMQTGGSHLSTVRRLSTDAAAEEANTHASALAEMDAAISGLGDWQRQRELDIARLKVRMLRKDGADGALDDGSDCEAEDDDRGDGVGGIVSVPFAAGRGKCDDQADDDDPASRAYEDRLRAELAALQSRREKLERESLTPRAPSSGSSKGCPSSHHHMPAELLISKEQIDQLTKDSRSHIGAKSIFALRDEVRELEAAAFDKQLREDQKVVTDPEMLNDEDVTRVAKEDHGFEEVFGLGNALSEYMNGLDDMMLKLDAVDAAVEASQVSSRSARASSDNREENEDDTVVVQNPKALRARVDAATVVVPDPAESLIWRGADGNASGQVAEEVGAERKIREFRQVGSETLVPESQ